MGDEWGQYGMANGESWEQKIIGDPTPQRRPYVEDDPDLASAYRRSAAIDRSEADGLAYDDPRIPGILASAEEFDRLAEEASHA